MFRRTAIERSDQRVAWERTDEAFFASGACHILAWVCRESYLDRSIDIAGVRFMGDRLVFHAYAVWGSWAFDYSGWNPESQLLAANTDFESRRLERVTIAGSLAEFCEQHDSRLPDQYWLDPIPRAREYLNRHTPPWGPAPTVGRDGPDG